MTRGQTAEQETQEVLPSLSLDFSSIAHHLQRQAPFLFFLWVIPPSHLFSLLLWPPLPSRIRHPLVLKPFVRTIFFSYSSDLLLLAFQWLRSERKIDSTNKAEERSSLPFHLSFDSSCCQSHHTNWSLSGCRRRPHCPLCCLHDTTPDPGFLTQLLLLEI